MQSLSTPAALLLALYWLLAPAVLAYPQGRIMATVRLTPPGPDAEVQSRAFHRGLTLAYLLPLLLALVIPAPWWLAPALSLLSRAALFDAALNYAEGRPLLYVGATAATDKLLGKLGPRAVVGLKLLCLLAYLLLAGAAAFNS